ncbi:MULTISPECIES: UvrD-helicase domain-containing protein [Citrobacter]|uniref:UvrD-helicase domain-containing protein n=1 Tax=Citrobacter TaxID=544 RepID=UPI0002412842|nr:MULTISPECIES: UvrD-helicase domain-containing protein [Citrobacter]RXM23432.1 ATP-dependent helicase [Citrobacter sp. AAK_AS5]EHL80058.1 hypothetical protein HMPREF9428_02421 [Citrobacter portucalensis]MCH2698924.1 ATP-dependent helicase [Citrobacter portucalensis]MDM2862725.1 AAA family ATPase [Citrobacter sp. Cpo073]QGS15574.1 AAA family ATPase [Citrobacter portucalensis]
MTSRIGSPDTQADLDVRSCLEQIPPCSFVMVAGAGSGKTTSLIKALAYLAKIRGQEFRRAGQKIACITYTEVAVSEISEDVGDSSIFHISTIHSFLWSIIRPFHLDIKGWVASRIDEKIADKQEHYNRPRVRAQTKTRLEEEIAGLEVQKAQLDEVDKFVYGTGSNYAKGILGHDDILKLTPTCIETSPLLRQLVSKRFPFIFVDESQDTNPSVVNALRHIARECSGMCVGFFGDPMQKIYMGGTGAVFLDEGWAEIRKPENFRCPTSVLTVINAIRAQGDGLEQIRGRTSFINGSEQLVAGSVNLFILPSDSERNSRLMAVRQYLARENNDNQWLSDVREGDVRLLVLVHRMAADRLGFPNLFSALTDRAPMSLSEGVGDGTAWPLRTFVQNILPLVKAASEGDEFSVMSILRNECPKLESLRIQGQPMGPVLTVLKQALDELVSLLSSDSHASIRDILSHINDTELLRLDERFGIHLVPNPVNDGSKAFENIQAFLQCDCNELWAYQRYFTEESPFATHHGVKGAQFERVLVVIDDEEARYHQYSYGKYFNYIPLSESDEERIAAGEESVIERTRRLFYVCCSRATKDLAVVVFVPDVVRAREAIIEHNIFTETSIRGVEHLM